MAKTNKLWLTNHEVHSAFQWCYGLMLYGEFARMRNNVIRYLQPLVAAFEADRLKVLEDHAKKDENEKPVIVDGKYQFEGDNETKVREVMSKLMNEEIPFTLDKDRKKILNNLYALLKDKFNAPLDFEKGKIYDELLTKLETIS